MQNEEMLSLAEKLHDLKQDKEELEAKVKALNAEIDEVDEALTRCMTEAEIDKFTKNGSTYYLKSRTFASPVADRKSEFLQALRDNNYGSLITESVNANTLASFVKEYCENNKVELPEFLPEELLNIYTKVNVGIKKS